ncbi:MAG: outer membrane protein assembly factor BamA [Sedimentisphaerales bacterium]|nr:outer membrane protein assembly factor BamA [Sedimentisphaerales bacterium]
MRFGSLRFSNVVFCCLLGIVFTPAVYSQVDSQLSIQPSPHHQDAGAYEISEINIVGNRSISNAEILSAIRSRVGMLFNSATAAEDARRVAELPDVQYAYYNSVIADAKMSLTFVVLEKNVIRSVRFVGNHGLKADTLRSKLDFKAGDRLDPVSGQIGVLKLKEFYEKKGYAFVEVTLDEEKSRYGELVYSIDEGPRVRIRRIRFKGNKAISKGRLKKAVKLKTRKFFIWPSYYRKEIVTNGVVRLQKLYQKRGFLNSSVAIEEVFSENRNSVDVTFTIDEGVIYTIEEIIVSGNKHFSKGRVKAELKIGQGDVFNKLRAQADLNRLIKLYRENGFIHSNVRMERKFVSDATVAVEFNIAEGERFRIGRINITGNQNVRDKVVRRVLDEYDFQPGLWYNAYIARGDGRGQLEKIVQRSVLTEQNGAVITPVGQEPNQRDAQVSIVEGRTGMVILGAGVATDSGVIGQLVFNQMNFDIGDWPESFEQFITGKAFRGAGQSLRIALEPGTEVSQYSVSFTEPYFQDRPVSLDVVGSSYKRGRESYYEGRTKGYVGFERRYRDRWRRSLGIRVENVKVDGIDSDAPQEIIDVQGDNALTGVRLGFGRDNTDSKFNPARGDDFEVGYEQVAGEHDFGVLSGTYRKFWTLYEDFDERKTILAAKVHAATTLGDAPPFEKFYAGGMASIRGFDYRGVSTRGLQTNVPVPQQNDPIGSDWIFLANAEVTVPLIGENFAALLFVDSGTIDSGCYRVSAGTGIQILIPQWFGPVPMRFGVATPLLKDDSDETEFFTFSIGRLF